MYQTQAIKYTFLETESNMMYTNETINNLYSEYLKNNEHATEETLEQFVDMATDTNGTLIKIEHEQQLYVMDYDRMRVYPMEEIIMWHAEYNDIKDKPNQVNLNQYIELITSKNGSCDKIYLNNDLEMDYINEMLKDGIDLEECISCVDNENCFNK